MLYLGGDIGPKMRQHAREGCVREKAAHEGRDWTRRRMLPRKRGCFMQVRAIHE